MAMGGPMVTYNILPTHGHGWAHGSKIFMWPVTLDVPTSICTLASVYRSTYNSYVNEDWHILATSACSKHIAGLA